MSDDEYRPEAVGALAGIAISAAFALLTVWAWVEIIDAVFPR